MTARNSERCVPNTKAGVLRGPDDRLTMSVSSPLVVTEIADSSSGGLAFVEGSTASMDTGGVALPLLVYLAGCVKDIWRNRPRDWGARDWTSAQLTPSTGS